MLKRFLLPALAVAVLVGSAEAADPSTATAWTCTSQTSGSAKYVVNGNELKKRDDDLERRYEACRREHPAPTPRRDDKISADAVLTDPCEPLDLQSDTFRIVSNNRYGLIAVLPEMGEEDGSILVGGRVIIIDKLTGHYVETLLSTPTPPPSPEAKKQKQSDAGISVAGYAGTCDAMPAGDSKPIAGLPHDSRNADAVVEEEEKPTKKSDMRKIQVHVHHYKRGHRHNPHPKKVSSPHDIGRPERTEP